MKNGHLTSPIRVAVLAFDGVSLFQLSVPAQAFGVVNTPSDFPEYEVRYCALKPGRVLKRPRFSY